MTVVAFDHVAIPTDRPLEMLTFYRALGFGAPAPQEWQASGATHFALQFGENKINVHAPARWKDPAFTLRGPTAVPGCGDFCFVWRHRGRAAGGARPGGRRRRRGAGVTRRRPGRRPRPGFQRVHP